MTDTAKAAKAARDAHEKRVSSYLAQILQVFSTLGLDAARVAELVGYDGVDGEPFAFKDHPAARDAVEKMFATMRANMEAVITRSTAAEWAKSNEAQDLIADGVLAARKVSRADGKHEHLYRRNGDQLKAFQARKINGMSLSRRVWDLSEGHKAGLEAAISTAVEKGMSAVALSKKVSQYLNDFPKLRADYKQRYGKAADIRDCQYESARLARTEINMAYRAAESLRWRQMDFVVGMEVKLSGSHPAHDICDTLKGKYPKDFEWVGWHPNCYPPDARVLTAGGWKPIRDVADDDLVLSLNPDTRGAEWSGVASRQAFEYDGDMVRFRNRSLECRVTADHRMVFLGKGTGAVRYAPARGFAMGMGAFYRSCEYVAEDRPTMDMGGAVVPFDLFCEFMGYWLADGSLQHGSGVVISQREGQPAFDGIVRCVRRMGFSPKVYGDNVAFFCGRVNRYLKAFGTCRDKFVPGEILEASPRQMRVFLDAFAKCDGHERLPHSFVGSRGGLFVPRSAERVYFTTSPRLCGNICELLLKVGVRPSLSSKPPSVSRKRDGSLIKGNYECHVIRECRSSTATWFKKTVEPYRGMVYDLTLAKNHIMYVEQGGKCYWGSNCICYKVPILSTEDEFFALDGDVPSVNAVSDVPNAFKEWVAGNRERIAAAEKRGTLPYFVRDNKARVDKILKGKRVKSEAEKEAIRKAWEERGKKNAETLKKAGYVLKHAAEYPDVDTKTLAAHISAGRAAQAAREAKEVAKAIAAAHKDEVALSAIIPDVHQWRKEFSSAELHTVYDAVEKKLQQWSALPLEGQAGKLKFEMEWVAKHKKYDTWEVARAAYGKRLAVVEDALEWQGIDAALADAKAFKTASKPYKELVAKLSAAAGAKDKAAAKSLVGEVAAKREALEKARMKTTVPKLEELSSARIKELLDEYANVSVKSMDKALRPSTEKTWATLTEQERLVLTKYTQTYSYLNEPLRGLKYTGERPKSEFDSDLPILTRALSKFTAPRDMVVRRGTGDFMIKTLGCNLSDVKVGDVFVDKGFLSTGAHRTKGFHKGIELVICVPKGAQGAFAEPFSHYTDENKFSFGGGGYKKNLWNGTSVETIKGEFEWIGQRGCEFRVVKKQGKRIFLSLIGQLK